MEKTLAFPDLLQLIDERSNAFRAAVAAAPHLDARVPTCPDWTLLDLAQHIGEGRRAWAATIAAGPAAEAKSTVAGAMPMPREGEALSAWLAASTQELLDALREAGPDRGCWTWWAQSQSPQNCGAVARHQLQQIAVHTYDAEVTLGAPRPIPEAVALDGVDEFLVTCCATAIAWPHQPAVIDYHATEGRSWRVTLSNDGAHIARIPMLGTVPVTPAGAGPDAPDVSARGTAQELVLAFHGRISVDSLTLSGDRHILDLLVAWDPDV